MKPLRLTIAGFMGMILVMGIGLAALRHPTRLWANATFSMALALDFGAVVAAMASEGRVRSAWSGFAICGWGYLVLALFPWFEVHIGTQLVTTPWIESAYPWFEPEPGKQMIYWWNSFRPYDPQIGAKWDETEPAYYNGEYSQRAHFVLAAPHSFTRIAHSLFGIAAGCAGGLLALVLGRGAGGPARSTLSNTGPP